MGEYKLYGFYQIRGLAESARIILHYGNQPFEDIRLTFEQWEKLKPTFSLGQLPVLQVDGKVLTQSLAIIRFLAKKFGLAGGNEWESALIDSVADIQKELCIALSPYLSVVAWHSAEGNKEKLEKEVVEPTLEKYLPIFEKILNENRTGFFVGQTLNWADIFVAENLQTINNFCPSLVEKHKWAMPFVHRIYSTPQLKQYLESRPHLMF